MVPIADDDGGITLPGMFFDDRLNLDHSGAGGIDDRKPGLLQIFFDCRRHPVGADQDGSLSGFRNVLDDVNAFFIQQIEYLGIMDQGAVSKDGAAMFARRIQCHFNSPSHAHAKSCGLGDNDFHE